ncbi:DUF397 domain-containing protein [Actinosynnema sp. NPDC059335]|uniref:DUF397 domain-containing protein n=1 Tax=Actinosynnema sp. NPDC059335 TaxID=3346804 RepID=UPI00366F3BA6
MPTRAGYRWRTSSYTNGGNDPQCVECGFEPTGTRVAVGDTKDRGPVLVFSARAFSAFVSGLRGA